MTAKRGKSTRGIIERKEPVVDRGKGGGRRRERGKRECPHPECRKGGYKHIRH